MNTKEPRLIIFDIDGTLADWKAEELLPGVALWFSETRRQHQHIALVTNQGGVGLRLWMEDGGFGEPETYPTEDAARAHIDAVNNALPGGPYPAYVCFAYQSKKSGKWAPAPDDAEDDDPEWRHDHRKPAPGMIFDAIHDAGTTRAKTLMVGDLQEDYDAAIAAGIEFQWARDFFEGSDAIPF